VVVQPRQQLGGRPAVAQCPPQRAHAGGRDAHEEIGQVKPYHHSLLGVGLCVGAHAVAAHKAMRGLVHGHASQQAVQNAALRAGQARAGRLQQAQPTAGLGQQAVAIVRKGQGMAPVLAFAPVRMLGREPQEVIQRNGQGLGYVGGGQQHGRGALTAHPCGVRACRGGAQQPVQRLPGAWAGGPGAESSGELGVGPLVQRQGWFGVFIVVARQFVPGALVFFLLLAEGRRKRLQGGAIAQPRFAPPDTPAQPGGHVLRLQPGPFGPGRLGQAAQLFEQGRGQWNGAVRQGRVVTQAGTCARCQCLEGATLWLPCIGQHGHGQRLGQCACTGRSLRHEAAKCSKLARCQPAGWVRTARHGWREVRAPRWTRWKTTPWGCPTARS